MVYVVHNTGEWVRTNDWTSATRSDGKVTEYQSLSDVPEFDRKQFEFMMEIGEVCLSSGTTVWQIRA